LKRKRPVYVPPKQSQQKQYKYYAEAFEQEKKTEAVAPPKVSPMGGFNEDAPIKSSYTQMKPKP
jgi:hypothetical protein